MVSDPNPKLPRDRDDEWIAIVVAFGVLGAAVAWPWLQGNSGGLSPATPAANATRRDGIGQADPRPETANDFPGQLESPSAPRLGAQFEDIFGRRPGSGDGDGATTPGPDIAPWPNLVPKDDSPGLSTPTTTRSDAVLTVPQPEVPEPDPTGTAPLNVPLQDPLVFSDVPADHWAKPYIDGLTARGILSGFPDGTFGPDQPMTRAQFAAQLAQAFEAMPVRRSPASFQDLGADNWAYTGVNQAVILGFMEGYPGSLFQPEQTVPRVQVMAALAKGLQIPPPTDAAAVLQSRPDQGEIPTWARTQTATAIAAQLVTSGGNLPLEPNKAATRAEVAAMLYQSLVYLGEVPPLPE
ncbi:MAG: S-layer homology domain-containing protein [Leptolyngbya sp.]|nr:S-layer homology domain-containing protein [Leptolyngbya sp.]